MVFSMIVNFEILF